MTCSGLPVQLINREMHFPEAERNQIAEALIRPV